MRAPDSKYDTGPNYLEQLRRRTRTNCCRNPEELGRSTQQRAGGAGHRGNINSAQTNTPGLRMTARAFKQT